MAECIEYPTEAEVAAILNQEGDLYTYDNYCGDIILRIVCVAVIVAG